MTIRQELQALKKRFPRSQELAVSIDMLRRYIQAVVPPEHRAYMLEDWDTRERLPNGCLVQSTPVLFQRRRLTVVF